MAREIPEVVRAAAGLAATVLDEARKLPETLPGLPVRLIGLAMRQAMKVQQQYAGFVARGDELFTGLRGEDEPGLATFDDDEPVPSATGFRDSAFDRAADTAPTADLITDEEIAPVREAPGTDEILDEIAIDELVDQAPTLEETAPTAPAKSAGGKAAKASAKAPKRAKATKARKPAKAGARAEDAAVTEDAAAVEAALLEAALAAPGTDSPATDSPAAAPSVADTVATDTIDAEPTADVATTVDVLTPAGDVTEVPATVTDEGVAAPEVAEPAPAVDSPAPASDTATATATDEGGTPVAAASSKGSAGNGTTVSSAPANPPIDGYDSFSVAQLRGRMRGYALSTVEELIAYEQATRARAPYLTMLRNRLEKLEEQAIESSPLAPRGA